jgi:hypothetical protein
MGAGDTTDSRTASNMFYAIDPVIWMALGVDDRVN